MKKDFTKLKKVYADDPEMLQSLEIQEQEEIQNAIEALNERIDTVKTIKGDDGHTPTKEELIALIEPLIPSPIPGDPGEKGKDADEEKIIKKLSKLIPSKEELIAGIKVSEIEPLDTDKLTKDILEQIPEQLTIDEIIKQIKEGKLIELRDIKGARLDMNDMRWHGGGISNITGLIQAGSGITITGSGTTLDPYIISDTNGDITGTGTPTQIAYFDATTNITSTSALAFNTTNQSLELASSAQNLLIGTSLGNPGGNSIVIGLGAMNGTSGTGNNLVIGQNAVAGSSIGSNITVIGNNITSQGGYTGSIALGNGADIPGNFTFSLGPSSGSGVITKWWIRGIEYTMPLSDSNGFFKSDGSGNLSWATIIAPSFISLPSTQIPYGDPSTMMTSGTNMIYDPVGGAYTVYLPGFGIRMGLYGGGADFYVDDGAGQQVLWVQGTGKLAKIGDVNGLGSRIVVDGNANTYTFNTLATGGATKLATIDTSGVLGTTATIPASTITGTPHQVAFFADTTGVLTSDTNFIFDTSTGNFSVYFPGYGVKMGINPSAEFFVNNGGGSTWFKTDGSGTIRMGDLNGSGTTLIVDNSGPQRYILNKLATGGATQFVTSDTTGILGTTSVIPAGSVTLTDKQIAFGNSLNIMTSSLNMTWDDSLKDLFLGDASGMGSFLQIFNSIDTIKLGKVSTSEGFWFAGSTSSGFSGQGVNGIKADLFETRYTLGNGNGFFFNGASAPTPITSFNGFSMDSSAGVEMYKMGNSAASNISVDNFSSTIIASIISGGSNGSYFVDTNSITSAWANSTVNGNYQTTASQTSIAFQDVANTYRGQVTLSNASNNSEFVDITNSVTANCYLSPAFSQLSFADVPNNITSQFTAGPSSVQGVWTDTIVQSQVSASSGAVDVSIYDIAGTYESSIAVRTGEIQELYHDITNGLYAKSNLTGTFNESSYYDLAGTFISRTTLAPASSVVAYIDVTNSLNSGAIFSSGNSIVGVDNIGTGYRTQISISDQFVSIGMRFGDGNATKIILGDVAQIITFEGNYGGPGNSFLTTDFANGVITFGDTNGSVNGTVFKVDEANEIFTAVVGAGTYLSLDVANKLYAIGDISGTYGSTGISMDDNTNIFNITLGGKITYRRSSDSGTFTVGSTGYYYSDIDTTGGVASVNLPDLSSVPAGQTFVLTDYKGNAATNNITLTPFAGNTIRGAATYVMAINYQSITIHSAGGNDWVIT